MKRAPYQVLVLPFRRSPSGIFQYAAFRRSDTADWQCIAGGGESDESPMQAAIRETEEEAGLSATLPFYKLDSICSIPVGNFDARKYWPSDIYVVTEYCFAVDATDNDITLSAEHEEFKWGTYDEIYRRLRFDSNKTALWELNERALHSHLEGCLIKNYS